VTSERPLSVLVVHNRYRSGQPSGEDRVVDQETALLSDAGHRVMRFERRSDDIASMSPVGKVAVPLQVPWNRSARADLARVLAADRPDVVHVHNTFPLISPSILEACGDAGVPVVATLHNYGQVCPPGTLYRDGRVCTDCSGRAPLPAVLHGCYRGSRVATVPVAVSAVLNRRRWRSRVARMFCVSDAQRDVLVTGGLDPDRLVVKPNVVPEPPLRRTGPGAHVLYVGRLTEEKGARLLMAAWDRLQARGGVGLPLVVAGAGPLEDELARWAEGRPDVRYLGLQTRQECAELMADAAAVLAPSVWPEVFGLVVVEAMAAAVPVVAAAHGAFVELVDEGTTGLLHRPGDADAMAAAIEQVLADGPRNRALGEAGRRAYEAGYSPAVGLSRLVAEYTDVIGVGAPVR
jgi:glycosyltransferase involved in cell wall biosynthesis